MVGHEHCDAPWLLVSVAKGRTAPLTITKYACLAFDGHLSTFYKHLLRPRPSLSSTYSRTSNRQPVPSLPSSSSYPPPILLLPLLTDAPRHPLRAAGGGQDGLCRGPHRLPEEGATRAAWPSKGGGKGGRRGSGGARERGGTARPESGGLQR